MKLSIIIPVYNEEKTVEEIIKRAVDVDLNSIKKEIIIVDDGSSDNSKFKMFTFANFLKKHRNSKVILKIISHTDNLGKGAAVRTGLKNSTGDIIIIQDADL